MLKSKLDPRRLEIEELNTAGKRRSI